MKLKTFALLLLGVAGLAAPGFAAEDLDAVTQAKVDKQVAAIKTWASDPVIVNAVKAQNASLPADYAAMTQAKWTGLTLMDPFVRLFSKNDAGAFLKAKKTATVSEAFLSDATGVKVAFLSKPTNWSHKGKPKQEVPMTGKTWQGATEVDESTGLKQVQVAVPVLDGDKPIGVLVVGLGIAKLEE